MRTLFFLIGFCFLSLQNIYCQHLIGLSREKVQGVIRNEMKGFVVDNTSVNHVFNYLKYVNTSGTKTLIVFFDEKDVSSNARLVCDYSELNFVIGDYNTKHKKTGKTEWEYRVNNEPFSLSLEEKEWYFLVHIRKKTKESECEYMEGKTESKKQGWLWKLLNY